MEIAELSCGKFELWEHSCARHSGLGRRYGRSKTLAAMLDSDEYVLWTAAPNARSFLRREISDLGLYVGFPLIVALILMVLFYIIRNPSSWTVLFALFLMTMPFVPMALCLGILILMIPFSPFLIISIGRNTTYSITNKRVLITVSGWFNSSRSYTIANQTSMQVKSVRHGDGSGDVYFASCWDKTGDAEIAASATQNIGFIAISCQQISVVEHILHSTYFDQYGATSEIFEPSHGQADRESIDLADKYIMDQEETLLWICYPTVACSPTHQAHSRHTFQRLVGLLPSKKFNLAYHCCCVPATLCSILFLRESAVFGTIGLVLSCIALAPVLGEYLLLLGVARKRQRTAYIVTDQVLPTTKRPFRRFLYWEE